MKRIVLLWVVLTGALLVPTAGVAQISCTRISRADVAVGGRVARAAVAQAARRAEHSAVVL